MAEADLKSSRNASALDMTEHPERTNRTRPFIHPRVHRQAENEAEIAELIEFCETGRVYAVERWVADRRPLQASHSETDWWNAPRTPLVAAIETNQYDLARLLLCNGYDPELEPRSILNVVLELKNWDFLELVLEHGADPKRADPDAVFGTYERVLIDRFWELGNDLTRERSLAYYLASTATNKPLFGWAKHHWDDPRVAKALALALSDAVVEGREKSVALLMWAGADSHRRVQSLRWGSNIEDDPADDYESAVERAVHMGHGKLLKYLRPDPALDDFEELYASVCDPDAVGHLTAQGPPSDWSRAIVRNAHRIAYPYFGKHTSQRCLELIFKDHGGRLSNLDKDGCQDLRRSLLKWEYDHDLEWLLCLLVKSQYCDPQIFAELTRTPAIQKRIASMRIAKPKSKRQTMSRRRKPTWN